MNKCGDCNVCCTILKVDGLKDGMEACKHQSEKGCDIYGKRPKGCSHFQCGYLTEGWKEEFRPDISGMMIIATKEGLEAYRLKDNVNADLFDVIKDKKVKGYDCRILFN